MPHDLPVIGPHSVGTTNSMVKGLGAHLGLCKMQIDWRSARMNLLLVAELCLGIIGWKHSSKLGAGKQAASKCNAAPEEQA